MKIQFKKQDYQTRAVEAVVDCFKGQNFQTSSKYTIDPGKTEDVATPNIQPRVTAYKIMIKHRYK